MRTCSLFGSTTWVGTKEQGGRRSEGEEEGRVGTTHLAADGHEVGAYYTVVTYLP
jgi:hypothetical protein